MINIKRFSRLDEADKLYARLGKVFRRQFKYRHLSCRSRMAC